MEKVATDIYTFSELRNNGFTYVDKSDALYAMASGESGKQFFIARPRRFGKSLAVSTFKSLFLGERELFADLAIAGDPSFEKHLNKYPVIFVDMTTFTSGVAEEEIVGNFQRELIRDVSTAYPQVAYTEGDHLMEYLQQIVAATGDRFFMIIDEWDAVIRMYGDNRRVKDDFVNLLRRMFKDISAVDVFAGVYMTGILPIKKYKTESALNNFLEYSMVEPGDMGTFFGFTQDEVKSLAGKHGMDFDELEKWYDGYQIGDVPSMFNPNSVMQAVQRGRCRSFWSSTGAFDAVTGYINMNFDGLRDNIIEMLAGTIAA